jgi:uncharacterized protein with PIN domain
MKEVLINLKRFDAPDEGGWEFDYNLLVKLSDKMPHKRHYHMRCPKCSKEGVKTHVRPIQKRGEIRYLCRCFRCKHEYFSSSKAARRMASIIDAATEINLAAL